VELVLGQWYATYPTSNVQSERQFGRMRALLLPALSAGNLQDAEKKLFLLEVEMALVIEGTSYLNKVCYNLEGDGGLGPFVYELQESLEFRFGTDFPHNLATCHC
jgi:hypothetical protein